MTALDAQLLFSDAQAVTATAASTNYIDFGAVRDMGTGEPLAIETVVDVAMTDASSDSTITVTLETDDETGFSGPTVAQTLYVIPAVSAIGYRATALIAPGALNLRYAQLRYTTTNGNLTTGSFTSYITPTYEKVTKYPYALTFS